MRLLLSAVLLVGCAGTDGPPPAAEDAWTPDDTYEEAWTPEDVYEIGTGITAASFHPTIAGEAIAVILNTAAAWWVPVAVRTDRLGPEIERVDVEVLLETDGLEDGFTGSVTYKTRPLVGHDDGLRYLAHLFVVLGHGHSDDWDGEAATLTVSLTPTEGGPTLTSRVQVILQKAQ